MKISDCDTPTVLVNKKQIRVHLDGIDAPERGQALALLCGAKDARVAAKTVMPATSA